MSSHNTPKGLRSTLDCRTPNHQPEDGNGQHPCGQNGNDANPHRERWLAVIGWKAGLKRLKMNITNYNKLTYLNELRTVQSPPQQTLKTTAGARTIGSGPSPQGLARKSPFQIQAQCRLTLPQRHQQVRGNLDSGCRHLRTSQASDWSEQGGAGAEADIKIAHNKPEAGVAHQVIKEDPQRTQPPLHLLLEGSLPGRNLHLHDILVLLRRRAI